jgi:NAD(P)-dependent dehydrogenase (short-subunit alcohol dehydrogenase family)
MTKKTVLVTGVTGTIGNATVLELAKNNCQLILLGRNLAKLEMVKEGIKWVTGSDCADIIVADLSEPSSVKQAAYQIKKKYTSLNALVYLAGISKPDRQVNSMGHEYILATNHLGFFILTNELLDLLKAGKPSRVITVSPPTHSKINFSGMMGKNKAKFQHEGSIRSFQNDEYYVHLYPGTSSGWHRCNHQHL